MTFVLSGHGRQRVHSFKGIPMNDGSNWIKVMWLSIIIFGLAVYSFVSSLDLIDAENSQEFCTEMVELYNSTDGEYGWPNCNHIGG